MKNLIRYCFPLIILLFIVSCSDNKDEETKGVPLQTAEGISKVDLSDRSEWKLMIGYIYSYSTSASDYNFSIDKNKIMVLSPKDQPFLFDRSYKEGDTGYAPLWLVSKDYTTRTKTSPTPPVYPNIKDQSTAEKFFNADALCCNYQSTVSPHIKDLVFTHANALLEFETEGLPENAKIEVYNYGRITPLRDSNNTNRYKAIAVANREYGPSAITITIDNKSYIAFISEGSLEADTHYTFKVKPDMEAKEFVIAFRIFLPIFSVILIMNCILGILSKVAPQMNMFSVGIQMKLLAGLAVMFLTVFLLPKVANYIFYEMKLMVQLFIEGMH